MSRPSALAACLLGALAGCGRPPEAPRELDDLAQYLYAEWDAEDPAVLAAAILNLEDFLKDVDLSSKAVLDRSWELSPLDPAVADEVDHPGRDSRDTLGVAVAGASAWPPSDHARLQTEPDQTVTEPTAARYDRTFPDDQDRCFPDRSCERLITANEVVRDNLVMSVSGALDKHFRWVEIDEGRWAFVSRSWIPAPWIGDAEKSKIWQSFSVDLWIPRGKGSAWRFQTLWSESEVANASDAIILGTVKSSTDGIFQAGDEAIEALYH